MVKVLRNNRVHAIFNFQVFCSARLQHVAWQCAMLIINIFKEVLKYFRFFTSSQTLFIVLCNIAVIKFHSTFVVLRRAILIRERLRILERTDRGVVVDCCS